jgi:nucleotide-binding universal stress UspA family protein
MKSLTVIESGVGIEGGVGHGPVPEHTGRPLLVVGVDGSSASWDAFSWAAEQARRTEGLVIAVFAVPLSDPELAMDFDVALDYGAVEDARDEMAEELGCEVAKRAAELGVEVSFVREYGDAAGALARVSRSDHADAIVVGRSASTLERLAGSLGRRLVLSRDLPVVVVVP